MQSAVTAVAFRPAAIVKGTILKIPGMIMVMMMIMMMIPMMMRKVSKWKTNQAFFSPSKPEDVRWRYQCRTGRKQRDWRTPLCCPEKSAQRWSSWKSCGQKAETPTQEPKPRDSAMRQTWEVRCCKMAAGALEWWVQMWNIWLEQKAVCSPKGWIVGHEWVSATGKRASVHVWGCVSLNGFGDLVINASVLKKIFLVYSIFKSYSVVCSLTNIG